MIIYDKNGNERFSNVEKFTYNDTFMGENFLNMDINSDIPIPFDIGDYCIFRNDRFELNYKPSVGKTSSRNSSGDAFTYSSIKMNSIADELTRCPFSDIVPSDYNVVWTGLTDFTFYAKTADMLGRRIQTCLDEMYAYQTSRIKILSGVSTNGIITITLNGNSIGIPVTTSCNTPSLLASYISGLSFNGYNLIYISGNDYLDFKATTKGTGLPPSITFGTTGSTGNINEIVKGNSWTVIVNKDNLVDYNKSVCNILQDDGQYRSSNGNLPIDSYMSFNNKTCSEALAELYNTFYVTYIVRGRTITVAPVGNLVGHTFGYDSDGGLLSLEKQTKQDSLLITRLSCFGSTRNISTKYYANLTGLAKSTINTDAESFQTDRFTFKSGASSAGSLNFTLNGDTYIVNGITTWHSTDKKIASYVYSNSSVFSDKWNLKLYNIQKKIRLTFTKNKEVQSLCSVNFVFGSYYFYPSATFFNSDTGLSDFAKDISSSLDDEQFSQCGWSKSYIEGTSYIEFTCNTGGIKETPNIYFHSQEISNTLSLLVTIKTEGVSYIDFTKKIAIRCSPPSFNGNSTGVTATTETISYGQISYAELSDNTGYYFSLDFQAGASIYKKTGSINGIPILIDGKTTYQVKFKIGIYEVSGYIVLENYLVTGFVYNTETNYNNFISLLSSNPTIYITEGVYLDMLSSEYVNYSTTLSNNLAVTHLMLPNFPLVESNPNNIFIDSDNITKYGIRKAVVFFDGSDAQHPEICPTIKDMTAKEVEDAGMSLSLDSNEGSDLTKIRLDEIKDCENPTDDGYIPTSIDSSYPGTTWFYLYIKDLGFDLSAMTGDNKYYYATTENMEVSMISGDCTGRTFKVTKIEKDTSLGYLRYKLTCDRYQDTNINKQYPNSDYKIDEGDIFVLLNIKLPQVYVLASSQKLLAYGNAYISKNDETKFQYVPKLAPKWMYEHSNGVDGISDTIHAGDLFDFSDTDLDVSGKVFIKTLTINVGTEQIPTYDITLDDEVESTTYQKIQNNIDNIMNQSSGGGTSSGTSSQTDLSNKYISKEKDDSTQYSLGVGKDLKVGGGINTSGNSVVEGDSSVVGKQTVGGDNNVIGNSEVGGDSTTHGNQIIDGNNTIGGKSTLKDATFNDLVQIINGILGTKDFASSIIQGVGKGWNIDSLGNSEMESLTIRRFLEVPEIRFNRTTYVQGDTIQSCAGGQIKSVTIDKDSEGNYLNTGTIELKIEDSDVGEFNVDDICISIFCNILNTLLNATSTLDDGLGNRTVKGFATSMFRITSVSGERNEILTYSLRGVSDRWTTSYHPQPLSTIAQRGNFSKVERQSLNISGIFPKPYLRIMHDVNNWEFTASMIGCQFGNMENLAMLGISMTGYSAYLNNIYMNGTISQFESIAPKMTFNGGGDNQIAEGQTKLIKSTITNGYGIDITDKYPYWQITRDTGNIAADNIWNAQAIITNGEFYLTWSSNTDDLGGKESALYTVTASDGISNPVTETISL